MVVKVTQIRMFEGKNPEQMRERLRAKFTALRSRVAEKMADSIVDLSPVDTGTYVMAHSAGTSESDEAADRSSAGKVRGRSEAQFKSLARHNLRRSVSSAAIQASGTIYFRNRALHANRVETLGWPAPLFGNPASSGRGPYRVYSTTRGRFGQFVAEATQELGFQTR